MSSKCSEEQFKLCQKSNLCHLCDGQRLFTKPKWMVQKEKQEQKKRDGIKKKPKEGMGFEKRAQKRYNQTVGKDKPSSSVPNARRRPNSGAIWCMPGDIVTEKELMECKERGSTTSKGEKTITIQKHQLDKIEQEAFFSNKDVWYYLFGFKECDRIYLVKDFEEELSMIQQINKLKQRIQELEGDQNVT